MTATPRSNLTLPTHREPGATLGQNRLIDAAVAVIGLGFDIPRRVAVAALQDASRSTTTALWDVAAGLVLADHLPPSLVTRLRCSASDVAPCGEPLQGASVSPADPSSTRGPQDAS